MLMKPEISAGLMSLLARKRRLYLFFFFLDMAGTFSVSMLTSLWASNSEESKQMRKVAPAGVFSFKDRHSDELCYQTVSEDLEKILQETKDVLTTLVPEQYRTFTVVAKTHSLLGRPLYITTNANGDFLFTGRKFVCKLRYST